MEGNTYTLSMLARSTLFQTAHVKLPLYLADAEANKYAGNGATERSLQLRTKGQYQ